MKNEYEIRGDSVAIFLYRQNGERLETLIDLEDFIAVRSLDVTWGVHGKNDNMYAWARKYPDGKKETYFLHRFIMNCPNDMVVDHIDGNGLNNKRNNLRIVTQGQNVQNKSKLQSSNKSGYRGVSREGERWRAQIKVNGKAINLGRYSSIEEANSVVEKARREMLPFS